MPVSSDREVLVTLYHAADGPNWRNSTNWLSDAPLNEWHHVSADSKGRVTRLDLSDNQLTGEIPPELGTLANLESLNLRGNELGGEIPAELGTLANLELLDLSDNQLTGEIPAELGTLAKLAGLYINGNQLSGEIPPELGNLANLRGAGPLREPVERGDTSGTGRPRQPDKACTSTGTS